jgi:hypothetical protein
MSFVDLHDRIEHALEQVKTLEPSGLPIDPDAAPGLILDGSYSWKLEMGPQSGAEERQRDRTRIRATLAINWARKVNPNFPLKTQRDMAADSDAIHRVFMEPNSDWCRMFATWFVSGPGWRVPAPREWFFGQHIYALDFYLEH